MRMYTSKEAADALTVSPQSVRRWIEDGKLQAEKAGLRQLIRIKEEELIRFSKANNIYFQPKSDQ